MSYTQSSIMLPLEIQFIIISYLDITTLHRSRSVCKQWKYEIDLMIRKKQDIFHEHLSKIQCSIWKYKPDYMNPIKIFAFLQKKIGWSYTVNHTLCKYFLHPDTRMLYILQTLLWNNELLVIDRNHHRLFNCSKKYKLLVDGQEDDFDISNTAILDTDGRVYYKLGSERLERGEQIRIYCNDDRIKIILKHTIPERYCIINKE